MDRFTIHVLQTYSRTSKNTRRFAGGGAECGFPTGFHLPGEGGSPTNRPGMGGPFLFLSSLSFLYPLSFSLSLG